MSEQSTAGSQPTTAGLDRRDFDKRYADGLATRERMFGVEHVAGRMAAVDDFSRPFAEFLNTHIFNDVWNRPGLSPATRSILNMGMLAALGRSKELQGHMRGALNNGVTPEEIREVLIQVAAYCGAPAAVDGFRLAAEVLREREQPKKQEGASE
jgi:4-carboxymuconolactone decarboxylase